MSLHEEWDGSPETLRSLLEGGKRCVVFDFTASFIGSWRSNSQIQLMGPADSRLSFGIGYSFISLFFGWWGIPWGPIRTVSSIYVNLRGGVDVTDEVVACANAKQSFPEVEEDNEAIEWVDLQDGDQIHQSASLARTRRTGDMLGVALVALLFVGWVVKGQLAASGDGNTKSKISTTTTTTKELGKRHSAADAERLEEPTHSCQGDLIFRDGKCTCPKGFDVFPFDRCCPRGMVPFGEWGCRKPTQQDASVAAPREDNSPRSSDKRRAQKRKTGRRGSRRKSTRKLRARRRRRGADRRARKGTYRGTGSYRRARRRPGCTIDCVQNSCSIKSCPRNLKAICRCLRTYWLPGVAECFCE